MGVYSNIAANEASNIFAMQNAPTSPLEFMIESHQDDLKFFEAVIELDFASAYNENGLISLTEDSKGEQLKTMVGKAKEVIKKLWAKFIHAITDIITKASGKIAEIAKIDSKMYAKNKRIVASANFKDCKIKGSAFSITSLDEFITNSELLDLAKEASNKIDYSPAEIDTTVSEFVNKCNEYKKSIKGGNTEDYRDKFIIKSEDTLVGNLEKANTSVDFLMKECGSGYATLKKAAEKLKKNNVIAEIEKLKNFYANQSVDKKAEDDYSKAINAQKTIFSALLTAYSAMASYYHRMIVLGISINRRNVITLINWAVKNDKKASKNYDADADYEEKFGDVEESATAFLEADEDKPAEKTDAKEDDTNTPDTKVDDEITEEAYYEFLGECSDYFVEEVFAS